MLAYVNKLLEICFRPSTEKKKKIDAEIKSTTT